MKMLCRAQDPLLQYQTAVTYSLTVLCPVLLKMVGDWLGLCHTTHLRYTTYISLLLILPHLGQGILFPGLRDEDK